MAIREILKKLGKSLIKKDRDGYHKGVTPNEVELNSFKERERLDRVKKELEYYRKKNAMLNQKDQDINIFKKQPSILKGSTLIKKKQKGGFWF